MDGVPESTSSLSAIDPMDIDVDLSVRVTGSITDEQWNRAKDFIHTRYIEDNAKFIDVAEEIKQNFGFKPTIHQFNRRVIGKWRFRKYDVAGHGQSLRKRQGLKANFKAHVVQQTKSRESLWDWAHINDSPGLTRLFGALSVSGVVMDENEIPLLNLDGDDDEGDRAVDSQQNNSSRELSRNDNITPENRHTSNSSNSTRRKFVFYCRLTASFRVRYENGFETLWKSNSVYNVESLDYELYPFVNNGPKRPKVTSQSKKDALPLAFYEARLNELRKQKAPESFEVVSAMNELADEYWNQNQHEKEAPLREQLVQINEIIHGEVSLATLKARMKWIEVLIELDRYKLAEKKMRDVRHKIALEFSANDELLISCLRLSGMIAYNLCKYTEADMWDRQVLCKNLTLYGPKSEQVADALCSLGTTLRRQEQLSESEKLYRVASQISNPVEGNLTESLEALSRLSTLAICLEQQNSTQEASALIDFVLTRCHETTLQGEKHLEIMKNNIAILIWQKKYQKSLDASRELLIKCQNMLGETHWLTAVVFENLAISFHGLGEYDEAVDWYLRALEVNELIYGIENKNNLWDCLNLGDCYGNLGQYSKALGLLQDTLSKVKKVDEEMTEVAEDLLKTIESRVKLLESFLEEEWSESGTGSEKGYIESDEGEASSGGDVDDDESASSGDSNRVVEMNDAPQQEEDKPEKMDFDITAFINFPDEAEDEEDIYGA